jgi:hypothetical protein
MINHEKRWESEEKVDDTKAHGSEDGFAVVETADFEDLTRVVDVNIHFAELLKE